MEADFSKLTFEALQETLLRFLCRHLVSLACWYQPIDGNGKAIGEKKFFCCSGFILSLQGIWNFATAGHILKDLQQHLDQRTIKVDGFMLADTFGSGALSRHSIPFSYVDAPKMYIYDENAGLDFGLIILRQHYQDLLKTNSIIPVEEVDWKNIPTELADKYLMLGLPQELISTKQILENSAHRIVGAVSPAAIGLTKIDDELENFSKTQYPRFIGKLSDSGYKVENIKGMSGGPIIGFSKDYQKYWIIAMQSSWLQDRRITFGCPIPVFAQLVEDWLNSTNQE